MHTLAITLVTYALPAPFYRKENISIEKLIPYATVSKLSYLKGGNLALYVPVENVVMLFCQK